MATSLLKVEVVAVAKSENQVDHVRQIDGQELSDLI